MSLNDLKNSIVEPLGCVYYENLAEFKITHDYFTNWVVICLRRGTLHYNISQSGEYILKEGQMLLCPPYCHFEKAVSNSVSVCILTFEDLSDMRCIKLGNPVFEINDRINESLDLIALCRKEDPYIKILQMDIWHQLCLIYKKPLIESKEPHYDGSIKKVFQFIDKSLDKKITLENLSQISGYSKAALIQKFKYYTGTTPIQYITEKRITAAKKLLHNRNKTLRSIALCVGFSNEFYFSLVFKKETGLSPSEFRRSVFK